MLVIPSTPSMTTERSTDLSLELKSVYETPEYLRMLYAMLGERPAYANISHREMPTYRKHIEHVKRDPYDGWYFIQVEAYLGSCVINVGNTYITSANEIGIHVSPMFQRQGFARRAIRRLKELHPREYYLANIAPGNEGSQKLFAQEGFRKVQETYRLDT
jgi:RimJ/RimL family protein N-acetyltransferase